MIPLKVHSLLDYLAGGFMIIAPWAFGFSEVLPARLIFLLGGLTLLAYSLLTNYYFSVARLLPLGAHMTLDTVLGIFVILAPALLGYRAQITQTQSTAHLLVGTALVGLVALTRPRTEHGKTAADRAAISHDLPVTR